MDFEGLGIKEVFPLPSVSRFKIARWSPKRPPIIQNTKISALYLCLAILAAGSVTAVSGCQTSEKSGGAGDVVNTVSAWYNDLRTGDLRQRATVLHESGETVKAMESYAELLQKIPSDIRATKKINEILLGLSDTVKGRISAKDIKGTKRALSDLDAHLSVALPQLARPFSKTRQGYGQELARMEEAWNSIARQTTLLNEALATRQLEEARVLLDDLRVMAKAHGSEVNIATLQKSFEKLVRETKKRNAVSRLLELGAAYEAGGRLLMASIRYGKALELNPLDPKIAQGLSRVRKLSKAKIWDHLNKGELTEASNAFEKFKRIVEGDEVLGGEVEKIASALAKLKTRKKREKELSRLYRYAESLEEKRQFDQVFDVYRRILRKWPTETRAQKALSRIFQKQIKIAELALERGRIDEIDHLLSRLTERAKTLGALGKRTKNIMARLAGIQKGRALLLRRRKVEAILAEARKQEEAGALEAVAERLREALELAPENRSAKVALERVRKSIDMRPSREAARKGQEMQATAPGKPGKQFKDCAECPEMIVVPPGVFTMGSTPQERQWAMESSGKPQWYEEEKPRHDVRIGYGFAAGKYEVTFEEWDSCVANGGCNGYRPEDNGWGRGRYPVIHVSWRDAWVYVKWLSRWTGKSYRLLSEAEWEYIARAGTKTPFSVGPRITTGQANFNGNCLFAASSEAICRDRTVPVGRFQANPFGLHDLHGNVWEWNEDCWHRSYSRAPTNGRAWTGDGNCGRHVLRGGSWTDQPWSLRSANRVWDITGYRSDNIGFRVARNF